MKNPSYVILAAAAVFVGGAIGVLYRSPASSSTIAEPCSDAGFTNLLQLERDCTRRLEMSGLTIKDRVQAYAVRGAGRLRRNHANRAIADFQAGLRLAPREARLYRLMSGAFRDLNQWENSLKAAAFSVELNPDSALNHEQLGEAFRSIGRPNEALAAYQRAIALDQSLNFARYRVAEIHFSRKEYRSALDEVEIVLKQPRQALVENGTVLVVGKYVDLHIGAIALRSKAIEELGDWKRSVDIARKLATEHRSTVTLTFLAERLYYKPLGIGDKSEIENIIPILQEVFAMDPNFASAWEIQSNVMMRMGKNDEAMAAIERILSIKSASNGMIVWALWRRSRLLQIMNRPSDAVQAGAQAFAVAIETGMVGTLISRLSRPGYWPKDEIPQQVNQNLIDAITACRLDKDCV